MSKKNILILFALIAGCFMLFTPTLSHAVVIGNESTQINISGWDSGLYYIITDPQGRRAGYNLQTKEYLEEFPSYIYISLDSISGENDLYVGEASFNLIPGVYTIEVMGTGLTEYSVSIGIVRSLTKQNVAGSGNKTLTLTPEQIAAIKSSSTQMSFAGVVDKDLTAKYQFTYSSDPTQPIATAEKILEPAGLKQDIELCRKLGWITSDGVARSLIKKAEAIDAAMSRGNTQAAVNQINALTNEIEAQRGKHILEESWGNAVKLLLDDAQLLLNKLQ